MKDVFAEASDDVMSRASDPASSSPQQPSPPDPNFDGHVCPFCGLTREITEEFDASTPCPRCTLADTPTTRNATKARIGPWHVRQVRNPWAPGMRFETLLALVKRGQVTKDSIVRGPTTHQLWKRASEIKGLSREFGLCHSCGGDIEKTAGLCPHCNRLQEPPINPDVLVEGREIMAAREAPPTRPAAPAIAPARSTPPAQSAPPQQRATPAPIPQPPPLIDFDEPPTIDIGATAPSPSDDPLAVGGDEDEAAALARQITARPPRQRAPRQAPAAAGPDDALLTPQELAQAFQLDFSPTNQPHRRGSKGKVIFVLLLLAAGGVAAAMYAKPEWRESATQWSHDKWEGFTRTSRNELPTMSPLPSSPTIEPPASLQTEPTSRPKPAPIIIAPPPAPVTKDVEVADDPIAPPPSNEAVDPPASAPVAPIEPPPATSEVDGPTIASAKLPESPQAIENPTPKPAVKKVQMPDGTAEEQAGILWRRAIDAEVNQDFVEAVECYELIKTLPSDVQPWGLDVRLDLARKKAK